ncbi:MAG: glycosyltransferase, partial [Bacteroides sp.]|nr:glycosyltransferase [Bacteroides sp.]
RECIDSILAQTFTDFELLIADDGSTDNSVEIVESYTDPRICLIRRPHDYIATLNCLLSEARGEYIARMDADDVMLPNRLQLQVDYMDANPEVDVLGGGCINIYDSQDTIFSPIVNRDLCLEDFLPGCCISHPTVLIRNSAIKGLQYSCDYVYAEDYYLWIQLLIAGRCLRNVSDTLIKYRKGDHQISSVHQEKQSERTEQIRRIICEYILHEESESFNTTIPSYQSANDLTVIIPFLNEGEEVINTVKSIRETVQDRVDIIVVNDHSTDSYPYEEQLSNYNVRYVYNRIRLGAALSKEKGVQSCNTKYFLLLDAHMRFFQDDWDYILISLLQNNPNRILCCQTIPLHIVDNNVVVNNSYTHCQGAYLTFDEKEYNPGIHWSAKDKVENKGLDDSRIPAILGAGYSSSCNYWNRIDGLNGLRHYGCEEAFISIKAWLEGGGCYLVNNLSIGHLYRTNSPFEIRQAEYVYNYLYILNSIFPKEYVTFACKCAFNTNAGQYAIAQAFIQANEIQLQHTRQRVESFCAHDINWVIALNRYYKYLNSPYTPALHIFEQTASDIENQINTCHTDASLYDGVMCYLLYLMHYCSLDQDSEIDYLIDKCIEIISDSINSKKMSFSLRHGVCGIGWGMIYLYTNSFIDSSCFSILNQIDTILSEYSPKRINDLSLEDGVLGIIYYVSKRMQLSRATNTSHKISEEFIDELVEFINNNPQIMQNAVAYAHCTNILNPLQAQKTILLCDTISEIYMAPSIVPTTTKTKPNMLNPIASLIKYYESTKFRLL